MIENSKRADKMWETRNSNTDSSVTVENALKHQNSWPPDVSATITRGRDT